MNRVYHLLLCCLFGAMMTGFSVRAQSVFTGLPRLEPSYSENFNSQNSTTQTCVSDVLPDRRGRLWVATCPVMAGVNGVRLFQCDGYELYPVNLANDELPNRSVAILDRVLPSGELTGFFESEDVNALFWFDPEQQSTRCVAFNLKEEGHIRAMAAEADGNVLAVLAKADSLLVYRVGPGPVKTRLVGWSNPGYDVNTHVNTCLMASILVSGNEAFVSSTNPRRCFRIPLLERPCRAYPLPDIPPCDFNLKDNKLLISDVYSQKILAAADGAGYFFFPGGTEQVFVLRPGASALRPLDGLPAGYKVVRMEQDEVGNLLFLLENANGDYAALLHDRQGRAFDYSAFVHGVANIYNIHSVDFLQSAYICADEGLLFKVVHAEKALSYILPQYSIRGMVELAPGELFITSQNKPSVLYHAASGGIEPAPPGHPVVQAWGNELAGRFCRAPDGSIWGAHRDTLVQYFPQTGRHRNFPGFPKVWSFVLLKDGRVAVTSQIEGLIFLNPSDGKVTHVGKDSRLGSLKGNVQGMCEMPDGQLWIATSNGLWRYDTRTGEEKLFGFELPFHDFRFMCIEPDSQGRLWLGTFLDGVYIFDPRSGQLHIVGKNQGLPNNTVATLTRDATGDFWAATYAGICHLSPTGEVIANLLRQDGLTEIEFNRYASLRTTDGTLLLGTINGLQIIRPALLDQHRKAGKNPKIYLTGITMAGKGPNEEIAIKTGLENLRELVLPPDRRHLRVLFALSSYAQPERNQFAYMLEGIDKSWTAIGAKRELNFNDLPAGRYTLLIRGRDFQGNDTESPVRIPIYAREFFYKEPWFYVLCALPFLAFGWVWLRRLQSERSRLEKEVQNRTRQIREDKALIERQAQDLRRLDEAKSRFFTNISHELRTPVTLVTAPVERLLALMGSEPQTEAHRNSLRRVLYNGRKLAALVEELLELSRLEAGKTELLSIPTAFFPWCRQVFGAYESQAELKNIRYRFDFSADPDLVLTIDRVRLEKVINNLLSNALKFTSAGGEVSMQVLEDPAPDPYSAALRIRVIDTGRGIAPEDLPHVFERYFQTTRTDVAREGGTGIGLALARELVLLMQGDLGVESEWGKGSTFTLSLVLTRAAGPAAPLGEIEKKSVPRPEQPVVQAPKERSAGEREHLLIVEDNPDMRELLYNLLSEDYQLSMANDGQEAWELLSTDSQAVSFSLILSDVMMPRLDGYGLLSRIKAHPRRRQVPLILLTARAEEEDKIQALRLGVDDYLIKPFSPPELLARVSNLIANYHSRRSVSGRTVPAIDFDKVEAHEDVWLKTVETAARAAIDKGLPIQVLQLAEAGGMSERQFFREIKRLTGLTPLQYIQEVRLQKARHLLQHRAYATLAEVAYAVGFETPTYFTRLFETHFGKHPSAYFQQNATTG